MKKQVLFVGHTGNLGKVFCREYADTFDITGMSRNDLDNPNIKNFRGDAVRINWRWVLEENQPDSIIYAPMLRPWPSSALGTITNDKIYGEFEVHCVGLIRMFRAIKLVWGNDYDELKKRSVVILSSKSALTPQHEHQFAYCAAKAAQISIGENARLHLNPLKVTVLTPGRFSVDETTLEMAKEVVEAL